MGEKTGNVNMFSEKRREEKERKRAEKEIEKFVKRAEREKNRENYVRAVALYQNAARTAKSIGDKRAVDFCMEAANCASKLGDDFRTGWSYKCAADYSLIFGDCNNALNFGMKAVKHFMKTDSLYIVQWCYNVMGRAAEKMKNYELAIKNYKKSLEIEHSEEIDKKLKEILKRMEKKKPEKKV